MADARVEAAERFEAMAAELERAAGHCRVTARHYREGDIPRAAAHAFAAYGHLLRGKAGMEAAAQVHASKSLLPGDDGDLGAWLGTMAPRCALGGVHSGTTAGAMWCRRAWAGIRAADRRLRFLTIPSGNIEIVTGPHRPRYSGTRRRPGRSGMGGGTAGTFNHRSV